MNRRFRHSLQITLVLLDILVLNLSLVAVRYFFDNAVAAQGIAYFFNFLLLFNLGWMAVSWLGDLYHERNILSYHAFLQKTLKLYPVWLSMVLFYFMVARDIHLTRAFVLFCITAFFAGLMINRLLYSVIRDYFRKSRHLINNVIILGYNEVAKKMALYLEAEGINTRVVGFSENYSNVKELSFFPIVSQIHDTITVSKALNVTEVYSTISPEQNKEVYDLMEQADKECVHFRFIPDFSYFINKPVFVEYFKGMPVLSVRHEPLEDVSNRFIKRLFDFAVSSFVIVFMLSWMIPLLGLLIYIESPGPIFFIQKRSGKNNLLFSCLKFRSMHINKDSDSRMATQGDARITRIGRFLRKSNLDEFPQFINVWKGEMSLIGPRPHMIKHTQDFSNMVHAYMVRQFLKPGITGWAQTHGYRGEIKKQEDIMMRVAYDIWYLENWTLWLDIRIIFLTIYNMVRGEKNAY
jgi:putative colanic acid biosysnthesis UDP-glucose lipid carrier transferase